MGTAERLMQDMKAALKSGDSERLAAIRMARAALQTAQITKRRALTEDEVLEVLAREVKQRREAAGEYRRLGQGARADNEERGAAVIAAYLPPQLSDAELDAAAREAIARVGAAGPGDIARVMATLMPAIKGKVDGKKVSEAVRRLLSG